MNFEKIKTLSFLKFVPLCPLMLVKRSKNLLYIDTTEWGGVVDGGWGREGVVDRGGGREDECDQGRF